MFRAQDETRMTARKFAEWIEDNRKETTDPEVVLREFNRAYGQLDREEQTRFFDKMEWAIRALPPPFRAEAARKLRIGEDFMTDWDRVTQVLQDLSH